MSNKYDFLDFPGDGSVHFRVDSGMAGRSGEYVNVGTDGLGTFAAMHAATPQESEIAR